MKAHSNTAGGGDFPGVGKDRTADSARISGRLQTSIVHK